jgi:DNA ligase (NAD+)
MTHAAAGDQDTLAELDNVDGVGPAVVRALTDFFQEPHNLDALDELAGEVEVLPVETVAAAGSALAGKTIVFTGTLQTMSRAEAKATAEAAGAKVTGSVSKNTDFVVIGVDAGSKAKKAAELGVRTLGEDEWRSLAGRA